MAESDPAFIRIEQERWKEVPFGAYVKCIYMKGDEKKTRYGKVKYYSAKDGTPKICVESQPLSQGKQSFSMCHNLSDIVELYQRRSADAYMELIMINSKIASMMSKMEEMEKRLATATSNIDKLATIVKAIGDQRRILP